MNRVDDGPGRLFRDDRVAHDQILRLVLDRLPVPLALHGTDGAGRFRYVGVNRAFERLWRVTSDMLIDTEAGAVPEIPVAKRWVELYRALGDDRDGDEVRTATDTVELPGGPATGVAIESTAFRVGPVLYGVTLVVVDRP